jgi:hypothetical protein
MLGKPPTLAYEGIGHIAAARSPYATKTPTRYDSDSLTVSYPTIARCPSRASTTFSEYDDLGDFDGRFESRSTLGAGSGSRRPSGGGSKSLGSKRKVSKGFLGRLKGGIPTPAPRDDKVPPNAPGRRLKALRSMGSLKSKAPAPTTSRVSGGDIPRLPTPPGVLGVALNDDEPPELPAWSKFARTADFYSAPPNLARPYNNRVGGRRSISFTAATARSLPSAPPSPIPSTYSSPYTTTAPATVHQAALGNALIAASHAESAKGTHSDLLQVLNHENHSWGFSYSVYPHKVRVWYGDKDEKIAENAVRWMERTMGEERCRVKVVKGADHGLMYKSSVVVEVMEHFRNCWLDGMYSLASDGIDG